MNLNDTVKVKLPGGIYKGKIVAIHKNYGFSKETKYEVHGKGFVTITSKRMCREHITGQASVAATERIRRSRQTAFAVNCKPLLG